MKIAKLHWAFPPVIGGVETHLAMLGPELIQKGHEVDLLTGALDGKREEIFYRGMRVKRTPIMDLNSLNLEKVLEMADVIRTEIFQFIEEVKPDIIHAHNMHYFSPTHLEALYKAKVKHGIPLVLTAHNVWDDELWKKMNMMSDYWDGVIAVSDYIKKELIKVGYPEEIIMTVHHGIDYTKFSPGSDEDLRKTYQVYPNFKNRRVIFHPARMSLDKGCHLSVKALKLIKKEFPDVLLVMAGTHTTVDWGGHQQRHVNIINNLIDELDLRENVFIKFFLWEEIDMVYQGAEIVIYPSCFEEPFGLVMLEAMATAKPIIVSRAGGMPEVVKDGVNGFIIPMNDYEALAERCLTLLKQPEKAKQMGETGRKMAISNFNKEIMTENTISFYKKALKLSVSKFSKCSGT